MAAPPSGEPGVLRRNAVALGFLAPAAIVLAFWIVYPTCYTVARSFFGTNWPVDRLYSSYGDVIDAYAEIVAPFSEAEQRALFFENAERIFRL